MKNSIRKPVRPVGSSLGERTGPGKRGRMVVYFSIWRDPMLWTYDDDHDKVVFDRCQQARDYAREHGFNGIQIKQPTRKEK